MQGVEDKNSTFRDLLTKHFFWCFSLKLFTIFSFKLDNITLILIQIRSKFRILIPFNVFGSTTLDSNVKIDSGILGFYKKKSVYFTSVAEPEPAGSEYF